MKTMKFVVLLMGLLLLVACKKQNPEQLPVKVTWDRDTCQECSMVISDHRYAAQIIDHEGKGFLFDDIGCAVSWLQDKSWKNQARIWVSDAETLRWIDAKKANWSSGNPNTPAGYGFTATLTKIENSLEFQEVKRRIETNQTLERQHKAQHVGQGHYIPKERSPNAQVPEWKNDSSSAKL